MRVVVVGGSAAGLVAALLLARQGHEVDVIDRDELEPAADVEAAAKTALRPTAPQAVHTHQYQPLARRILREHLPDVYVALLDAGAAESPLSDRMPSTLPDHPPRPGDEELTALQARRSTFDWVLRTFAAKQPTLRLLGRTRVTGLLADSGDPPNVLGVRTDRDELRADVVVDAAGRRSPVDRWLSALHTRASTAAAECGIAYYTRHFRLRTGASRPAPGRLVLIALLPYFTVGATTADNDTLTVSLCPLVEDRPLRALREPDVHEAVARTVPRLADWLEVAEPISDVHAMGGLRNTLRRLVVDDRPVAVGLHAVGDSVCTLNPTLGRGLSMAFQGAVDLTSALADHPTDRWAQAYAMDSALSAHIAPWYAEQAALDETRLTSIRRSLRGEAQPSLSKPGANITPAHLRVAAMVDPDLFRAFTSVLSMVRLPDEVYGDPAIAARVRAVLADHPGASPAAGPSRAEILAALG